MVAGVGPGMGLKLAGVWGTKTLYSTFFSLKKVVDMGVGKCTDCTFNAGVLLSAI